MKTLSQKLFVFIFLAISAICYSQTGNVTNYSFPQVGERIQDGNLIIVNLQGSWQEMGQQYGRLLKQELHKVLAFAKKKATKETDAYLMPNGIPMGIDFLDNFFEGIQQGSGLTAEELVTINGLEVAYATEFIQQEGIQKAGQCSTLALYGSKTKNGQMLVGRNYDWTEKFLKIPIVLARFQPKDTDLSFTTLNYPGCIYLTTGMNSTGLFVELNTGLYASEETDRKVIHNAWMLWHVLLEARSASHAVNLLHSLRSQSCYLIGLADSRECFFYEWGVSSPAALKEPASVGILAFSNHFVQKGWKNLPSAYEGGCESSINRRAALMNLSNKIPDGTCDVETLRKIMEIPAKKGGAKCPDTLFQVMFVPEAKALHIWTLYNKKWTNIKFSPEAVR